MILYYYILEQIKQIITSVFALAVLSGVSCSSSFIEQAGREGIRGDTLRVYITLDIPEEVSPPSATSRMTGPLLEAGKKRAILLLTGYVREKISDPDRAEFCLEAIGHSITSGKMIDHECDEEVCSAFMDYDIKEFLKSAHGSAGR